MSYPYDTEGGRPETSFKDHKCPHEMKERELANGQYVRSCLCGYTEIMVANGPDDFEWQEIE